MVIVTRGTDFRDDDFDAILDRNRTRREGFGWVDGVDFDRSGGERFDCGSHKYDRVVLRLETAGEGED